MQISSRSRVRPLFLYTICTRRVQLIGTNCATCALSSGLIRLAIVYGYLSHKSAHQEKLHEIAMLNHKLNDNITHSEVKKLCTYKCNSRENVIGVELCLSMHANMMMEAWWVMLRQACFRHVREAPQVCECQQTLHLGLRIERPKQTGKIHGFARLSASQHFCA